MGKSLRTVLKEEGMPAMMTVYNWFRSHPEFLEQYARAKEEGADAMAEEMMDIADESEKDYIQDAKGNMVLNNEHVQRSRLRVDTRKWYLSKIKPKRYGEKLDVTTLGDKVNVVSFNYIMPKDEPNTDDKTNA